MRGYEATHLLGIQVRILPGGIDVRVVHCQIIDLCKGLNTCLKEHGVYKHLDDEEALVH